MLPKPIRQAMAAAGRLSRLERPPRISAESAAVSSARSRRSRVAMRRSLRGAGLLVVRLAACSSHVRAGSGYWIDEGIAVGIASHDLADIPRLLAQDGNPPLYYLLLHGWMQVFGDGEAATRALSLVFALLAVPASFWAGSAVFDRRAGALAAAGAAGARSSRTTRRRRGCTRWSSLLSILASASFVLAFVRGDRRHVRCSGCGWRCCSTRTPGACSWPPRWRSRGSCCGAAGAVGRPRRRAAGRGARAALRAVAAERVSQAANTAAPWAERPSPLLLLGIPGGLFGHVALPLLRRSRSSPRCGAARRSTARSACWPGSRSPRAGVAWLVLADRARLGRRATSPCCSARCCSRSPRSSRAARAGPRSRSSGVAVVWLMSGPPPIKSNVRTVVDRVAPSIRPGDLVVSTQPEQVPALYRYLPAGRRLPARRWGSSPTRARPTGATA